MYIKTRNIFEIFNKIPKKKIIFNCKLFSMYSPFVLNKKIQSVKEDLIEKNIKEVNQI